MSLVNFDPVFEKTPDLKKAADELRHWLEAHDEIRFLDAVTLGNAIGSKITIDQLVRVLAQLVAAGQVELRYGISLPDGTFAEDFFEEPSDVPPVVFDSSFQPVTVEDKYIVPVYLPHST